MWFGEFKVCFIPFTFRFSSDSISHTPLSPYSFLFVFMYKKSFPFVHPPDDGWSRKNFKMRDATVMKNNLNKARTIMNRPSWINVDIWPSLCNHWASQAYKKKRPRLMNEDYLMKILLNLINKPNDLWCMVL